MIQARAEEDLDTGKTERAMQERDARGKTHCSLVSKRTDCAALFRRGWGLGVGTQLRPSLTKVPALLEFKF